MKKALDKEKIVVLFRESVETNVSPQIVIFSVDKIFESNSNKYVNFKVNLKKYKYILK